MRLITRSDFDGIVCAVLLEEIGVIDSHMFCHPKDIQDGKIPVSKTDILANLPYVEGCGLWLDHHNSNLATAGKNFVGTVELAPSAARVVWNYYGGVEKFGEKFVKLLHYVDKVDSADLTTEEILHPSGWILLGFLMDPRSGFGHHRHFKISNLELMSKMIGMIQHKSVEEILADEDVQSRVEFYHQEVPNCIRIIQDNTRTEGKVLIYETRYLETMPVGNRFLIYGLYPECNVSIQIGWGRNKENVFLSVGKSTINRTNQVDIGSLLAQYGGGGHKNVGTCQIAESEVDQTVDRFISTLN